jgi:hypothetical protein
VRARGARARGVAFGMGAHLPVGEGEAAEATFRLEVNEWRGVTEPRLVLRHARLAEQSPQQPIRDLGASTEDPSAEDEELVLFA